MLNATIAETSLGDPMAGKWLQALLLVGSNVAILVPVPLAWRKGLYSEAAIYTTMTIVSCLAHYTAVYECCVISIGIKCYMEAPLVGKFDLINAFQIISTSFMMVIYPLPHSIYGKQNINPGSKDLINAFICILVTLFMGDNFDKDTLDIVKNLTCVVLTLFCIGYTIFVHFVLGVKFHLDVRDFVLGMLFFVLGIWSFALANMYREDFHWFIHTFWHIFMGFALWFFVDGKEKVRKPAPQRNLPAAKLYYYAIPANAVAVVPSA